jgi:outer membrane murein-binding lipoprotein Lpp
MKIVSTPTPVEQPAPPPKAVIKPVIIEVDPDTAPASQAPAIQPQAMQQQAVLPQEWTDQLKKLQVLQDQIDHAGQKDRAQIEQISRDIASLASQVAALRKTITDIQAIAEAAAQEPAAEKPAAQEAVPEAVVVPLVTLSEKKVEPPATGVKESPKKVAFLGKLWDYFNETAFEVPLKKSDRK